MRQRPDQRLYINWRVWAMNRFCYPTTDLPDDTVQAMLVEVDAGMRSVRNAASALGWTPDEVQLVIWGEVRQ